MHIRHYSLFAILAICVLGMRSSQADDWPQWMGPNRNNVWSESGILERFPEGGPKVLWRTPIAGGYSGPAVADGRVYITDYVTSDNVKVDNFERKNFTGVERTLCLNEESGAILWRHESPVKYSMSYPSGPRCTPAVEGDEVYTLGAEGNLNCFAAKTGKVKWSKNLPAAYDTKTPLWGYSAHPLVDGDRLLTLAGGDGSHTVAFDRRTGKEIWRSGTVHGVLPGQLRDPAASGTRHRDRVAPRPQEAPVLGDPGRVSRWRWRHVPDRLVSEGYR